MGGIRNYFGNNNTNYKLIFVTLSAFYAPNAHAGAILSSLSLSDTSSPGQNYTLIPVEAQSAAATIAIPAVAFGPPDTVAPQTTGLPQPASVTLDPEQEAQRIKRRKLKTIQRLEIAYQVLGALDAAQTISCVSKPTCHEGNPLLGKRPSVGAILGFKLAAGLLHYAAMRNQVKKDRLDSALTFEIISISVQGIVCGLNFRHVF